MQTSDRVQIRMPVALKQALAAHPYAKPHSNGRAGGAALAGLRLLLEHFGMEYVDPHEEQARAYKSAYNVPCAKCGVPVNFGNYGGRESTILCEECRNPCE